MKLRIKALREKNKEISLYGGKKIRALEKKKSYEKNYVGQRLERCLLKLY